MSFGDEDFRPIKRKGKKEAPAPKFKAVYRSPGGALLILEHAEAYEVAISGNTVFVAKDDWPWVLKGEDNGA